MSEITKVSIKPAPMTLEQAVNFYDMLDTAGQIDFLNCLSSEEAEQVKAATQRYGINDKVIVTRIDGSKANGTVINLQRTGYYRVAYIVHNQVTVSNIHQSRLEKFNGTQSN